MRQMRRDCAKVDRENFFLQGPEGGRRKGLVADLGHDEALYRTIYYYILIAKYAQGNMSRLLSKLQISCDLFSLRLCGKKRKRKNLRSNQY